MGKWMAWHRQEPLFVAVFNRRIACRLCSTSGHISEITRRQKAWHGLGRFLRSLLSGELPVNYTRPLVPSQESQDGSMARLGSRYRLNARHQRECAGKHTAFTGVFSSFHGTLLPIRFACVAESQDPQANLPIGLKFLLMQTLSLKPPSRASPLNARSVVVVFSILSQAYLIADI